MMFDPTTRRRRRRRGRKKADTGLGTRISAEG